MEKETSSEKPVYFNLCTLFEVREPVMGFLQQLQISFWNKGLKKEDPLYTKAVLKDLIGLKACDGKTNVIKLKNKAGREEFVSVWADQPELLIYDFEKTEDDFGETGRRTISDMLFFEGK